MRSTHISHNLTIVHLSEGIKIQYMYPSDEIMEVFSPGLSHRSIAALAKELKKPRGFWVIDDNSFTVTKNDAQIEFSFLMQAPPFERVRVTLTDDEAEAFNETIFQELAEKN